MKIKDISKVDLPRERLLKYGINKLSDSELLALVLGSGIKGVNVLELAKKILNLIKKIGVKNVSLENLLEIKGLGYVKAGQVLAILALSSRLFRKDKIELLKAKDIWMICSDISSSKKEHLVVFYIDSQSRLIEKRIISVGILNGTVIHPREVFEPAVTLLASSIIMAHNHPSGDLEPSFEDREITKNIKEAGKILGITLLDHIIVSKTSFYSFKENNLL